MKIIDIALKDLKRSFRSAFALVFMFVVPLGITGMFYLMFGNSTSSQAGPSPLAITNVIIADLDQGSPDLAAGIASIYPSQPSQTLGNMLVDFLQSDQLKNTLSISLANDAISAQTAVDNQQASAAIIIPTDFSASYANPTGKSTITLYQDPARTEGSGILRSILNQYLDTVAGMKIVVNLAARQAMNDGRPVDAKNIAAIVQQYAAQINNQSGSAIEMHTPVSSSPTSSMMTSILAPIMGGMMIFFAFFTAGSTAQSILKEDEDGTLPRLFTTPTPQATILGGKFLSVGLIVVVQVIVLFLTASLVFKIHWGSLGSVALAAGGIMIFATTFGIFITSLVKSTRQGGVVYGGFLTVTGMVGMMSIFSGAGPSGSGIGSIVPLFTPQGWAVRGLLLSLNEAAPGDILLNTLVILSISILFFILGILRFQKRYA